MLTENAVENLSAVECRRLGKKVSLAEPHCLDPRAYCKYRTGCPIHILEKEARRAIRENAGISPSAATSGKEL